MSQTEPAMHRFPSLALIGGLLSAYFCLAGLALSAQENRVVRVGVATLQSGPGIVPGAEARDRLVKALNQRKTDKSSRFRLEAVALKASLQVSVIAEAREKNCDFVLYTHLTDLTTTFSLSTFNDVYLPDFHATVEYQLNRVADGSGFAISSVDVEDSESSRGAIWTAVAHVANKVSADVRQGKGTPDAPAVAGMPAAAVGVPSLVQYVDARNYCSWLPGDIAHAEALRGGCEYAISLPEKMPNFVCGQETARYRGDGGAPVDLISASVRYEDGHESYSDIRVNDHPLFGVGEGEGLRSTGEFGGNLRAIFNRTNRALFSYSGEGNVGEHSAWIFTYQIAEQKERLWMLHAPDQTIAPAYSGELWIDQKNGGLLRFRSVVVAKDLPPTFPMKSVDLQIDYEKIGFGDGTNFVLPVDSMLTNVYAGEETSRNAVHFRNCHKFRARGRLVLNADRRSAGSVSSGSAPLGSIPLASVPEGSAPAAQVPASAASLQKDLDESEAIFAAIRDGALQQDEVQREGEQKQMLDAVTASTLQRLSELRREQQEIQVQRQTVAAASAKSNATIATADNAPRTAFRVDVRLVPVSVVLRDGKGQAVGSMVQDNFRLFDEGRLQVIKQFSVEAAEARMAAERAAKSVHVPEAIPPVEAVPDQGGPTTERATAYLFDDVHSNSAELASARDAAVRHIGSLKAGERAALFTTSGAVVIDFTDDREKLLAGLRSLKPRAINFESDCPPISPYIADLMINKRDPDANSLAVAEVIDCAFQGSGGSLGLAQRLATAKALEVLDSGNAASKNAIEILSRVIRRTASMPGQRSIVMVSPGFLALTPDLLEDVMALVEGAVHSGIIINALDAHGLSTVGVSGKSSLPGPNGFLFANAEAQALGDVMAEFASGTGGVFFHNNNNLDEGFRRTADAPAFVYVLGFSPQKLDGRFHKLKVTLTSAEKLEVQARRGYYAFKPVSSN
ncbi:MAG: VWA domain-containing protein [Candidatus Sulfotelmatobacter sp.]